MSWQVVGAGREELRTTLLSPYLEQALSMQGFNAVQAVARASGVSEEAFEDETRWLPIQATVLALQKLQAIIGERGLESYGQWRCHAHTLGVYPGLLRSSNGPLEAFRYRVAHGSEITRVGTYHLHELSGREVQVSYTPAGELDTPQHDKLLCLARQAELRSLPVFWGLPEASTEHLSCLANGDDTCRYIFRWREISAVPSVVVCGVTATALSATATAVYGPAVATGTAAVALGVGSGLGVLWARLRKGRKEAGTLERLRITALERSLELRSHVSRLPGELAGSLLAGKYRLGQRIGGGGIGVVYAATNVAIGAPVAIKLLKPAAARDGAEGARLRREARVQLSVDHPNIARTLDLDTLADGSTYIVMELLEGENLSARLRKRVALSVDDAFRIFSRVCSGLQAAHNAGVVHRDLKPANIYLCSDGRVKVLDFGMGKFAGAADLTETGYTLGTPEYMSPEQCLGSHLDGRSDVYSLGVLLYQSLTGELPFRTGNRRDLLNMHQSVDPTSMGSARPDLAIPKSLDDLVLRCLAKDPDDRPPTAEALAKALLGASERQPATDVRQN